MSAPRIYHLRIDRFRGIKNLSWHPASGINVILGGGDVGKTTILEAIGFLLSPTNQTALADTDYHGRDIEAGFSIEAVVRLPPSSGISYQDKHSWPWHWNGIEAVVPSTDDDAATTGEQVYRLRVRGAEHELFYEIVQPDGGTDILPVSLRRSIGLVRLAGDDRNDRDLRLVQGSALDRLLSDKGLRARLASGLAKKGVKDELLDPAKELLNKLDRAFTDKSLPAGLDLAITGGQGFSVTALIGLTADRQGVQLPLASWGAGTRRMAALVIAEQNQGEAPITLVDEIERGLEPYRQRALVAKLQEGPAQVFVTTHSPYAIAAASTAALWYVDHEGRIGPLDLAKTRNHRAKDPETFLARLTIVAEGATECGFATALLEKSVGALEDHGIHVTDGGGHESTLGLLEALAAGGLRFGGFADNEQGKHPTRWSTLAGKLSALLFRWNNGCLEQNVIDALPDDRLEALLTDPVEVRTGQRLRTLADRLGTGDEKGFATIKTKAGADLKATIIAATLGKVPPDKVSEQKQYQAHERDWFKNTDGGRELAEKMFSLGAWPALKPQLMPFCNAVRKAVGLPEIQDLAP
jgi:putative ATP-dependent endonuclease of the OLD family